MQKTIYKEKGQWLNKLNKLFQFLPNFINFPVQVLPFSSYKTSPVQCIIYHEWHSIQMCQVQAY